MTTTNRKYELTDDTIQHDRRTLYRIRALRDIPRRGVRAGCLGGFVESEANLSHEGDCWIGDEAYVYKRAHVSEDAHVFTRARVGDDARVSGSACVSGRAWVIGRARVDDDANVAGDAEVDDDANVSGRAWVAGYVRVGDDARVGGRAHVTGDACVSGDARLGGSARAGGSACVSGDARANDRGHIFWVDPISSNGEALTVFRTKGGGIFVNHGCFSGTLDEFAADVEENHGDNQYGKEYRLLIEMARIRAESWGER